VALFRPDLSFATLLNPQNQYSIQTFYQYAVLDVPGTPPVIIPRPALVLSLPNPTSGGVVGRTKISDDNNPLPRDRVFFSFDYFQEVPLTAGGVDVRRFSPGFEKTFLDRRASVEVRFPFALTLSSDINAEGLTNTNRPEFGNVNVTFKGLLYRGQVLNVASGLGVAFPTADDTRVFLADGTEVLRIRNEAYVLTPYAAFLLTPCRNLFFQSWGQVSFDVNGNPVATNPNLGGLRNVDRLTDQKLLQVDAQLGYWLYQSGDAGGGLLHHISGLAPFVELHWNTTLNGADFVQAGEFTIGGGQSHFDELNLSTGLITRLGDHCTVTFGAVFPLKERSFDYQLGVHGNIFFGSTGGRGAFVGSY
jgi:hypothetical protein